jgi:hypothetical protein
MFIANTLTIWSEAIKAVLADADYEPSSDLVDTKTLPVHVEYPQERADYPGIWLNFTMQGDVKNVGIGHVEYVPVDEDEPNGIQQEVFRWHFGGLIEITLAALGNLERANLVDEMLRIIATGRMDKNGEGVLRETVERNDLVGQRVTWESVMVSGFGEVQGTPWGTDDVVYEATITIVIEGEVVMNPATGDLEPLSGVILSDIVIDDPETLPTPGTEGWV